MLDVQVGTRAQNFLRHFFLSSQFVDTHSELFQVHRSASYVKDKLTQREKTPDRILDI
jgi:hypothetical protein